MDISPEITIQIVDNGCQLRWGTEEPYEYVCRDRKGNPVCTEQRTRTIYHDEVYTDVNALLIRIKRLLNKSLMRETTH